MYCGTVSDLEQQTTPFLRVDLPRFESNLLIMSDALPGTALRPHVKAFKSTAVAKRLYSAGHTAFLLRNSQRDGGHGISRPNR